MYLHAFIYSVKGVGPRNICPIKILSPNERLSYLPVNMYLYTSAHPVWAERIRHQHIHVRCADRARMAGKYSINNLTFLPRIVVLLLTVIYRFLSSE